MLLRFCQILAKVMLPVGKFSENVPTGGGSAALLPVGKSNNPDFWEIQQPFGEIIQQQAGNGHMITEKLTSDGLK